MKSVKFGLLVATALIFAGLWVHVQQNVGNIVGTVSDPSRAVVPGFLTQARKGVALTPSFQDLANNSPDLRHCRGCGTRARGEMT